MNKHEAEIALALIKANHTGLVLPFTLMVKVPFRSVIGLGFATALGASLRWHDVEWVWRLLT